MLNIPIAHSGLHGDGVPENSALAYKIAIVRGIPIEMDVQMTADKELVCFHDDNMARMTGEDCLVWDKTLEEIKAMTLGGTAERILTFAEFLELVRGAVPVMIELKTQKDYKTLVAKVIEQLKVYDGEYAVQSFDPRMVGEVAKLAPDVLRGQLVCKKRHEHVNFFVDKALGNGLLNFISKPDFININAEFLPVKKSWRKKYRIICWTIRTEEEKETASKYADNYIFERLRV